VPEEGVLLYRRRGEEEGMNLDVLTTIILIKRQLSVTAVFNVISYQ
jgi:hypothetical protein